MLILLFPLVIFLGTNLHDSQSAKPLAWRQALFLYRSSFLILLHIILVGINVYGWSASGVNHVLIFEIDPRKHLTYQQFLEIGTFLFIFWFLSFVAFILSFYYDFYPFAQPISFLTFILLFILNPTPTFYPQARFWLLKTFGRVICAPLYHVSFADFWLADQLTSLEMIFFDIQHMVCFYTYDVSWWPSHFEPSTHSYLCHGRIQIGLQTLFMMLPSWFRFAQCLRRYHDTKQVFPHLANAGKYATGFFVLIANSLRRATMVNYLDNPTVNPFLYFWIGISLFASTYKLLWDYLMDWGFFSRNPGENRFLRDQLVYPSKSYYYSAMCLNFVLRYIWIINIFMHFRSLSAEYASVIGFIFGLLEIFRRFIWNYFRLENEHLNNCGNFRAVRDISIAPMTNSFDHGTLEDMMDRKNGVRNRSKSRKLHYQTTTVIKNEENDSKTPLHDITNQQQVEEINTTITILDSPMILTDTPDPVL